MQIVFPDTIEDVASYYQVSDKSFEHVLATVKGLSRSKRMDLAEELLRHFLRDMPKVFWPYCLMIYAKVGLDKNTEAMSLSAQIIKNTRQFDDEQCAYLVHFIYKICIAAYENQDMEVVKSLTALAMRIHSYGKAICSKSGEYAPLTSEEFRQKIEDETKAYLAGKTPKPSLVNRFHAIEHKNISELEGQKVFCVFREHAYNAPSARKVEFLDFYHRTAKTAGLVYREFTSDRLIFKTNYQADLFRIEMDKLIDEIKDFQPDYVYIDNFLAWADTDMVFEVRDRFKTLKSELNFKLIGFYADAWNEEQMIALERAAEICDAFHHTQSSHLGRFSNEIEAKTLCVPCPYPKDLFYWPDVERDVPTAFIGSFHPIRLPWFYEIKDKGLDVQLNVSTHNADTDLSTTEAYAKELARYQISLIFSARSPTKNAVTGAVFETIVGGGLLMEEESSEMKDYFVPFVHYIPFKSFAQLSAYIGYLQAEPDLMAQVSKSGFEFFDQEYHSNNFWSALLSIASS